MADEATASVLSELYANIVQSAIYTLSEQTVIRPLVANYDMSGTPGLTAQIPIFPAITAAGLTDGTDITQNTAFNTTSVEVTCAEIGAMIKLTDLGRESAAQDVAVAIGRQMGDALAKKVDGDLANLFTGFSQSVGSGNTELTADLFFKAGALLRIAQAPGPYVAVVHPGQAYQLRKVLTNAGANVINHALSDVGNEALRSGFISTINGISIFESTVVSGTSDGAFVGAVMSSQALAYVLKRQMRIEEQRDASLRSTEYVGSMAYGVKELIDTYGVRLLADARTSN
jgi:N4-gp56 family major capsid protein